MDANYKTNTKIKGKRRRKEDQLPVLKKEDEGRLKDFGKVKKKADHRGNPTDTEDTKALGRFEEYHRDGNKDGSLAAKRKEESHLGITLKEEEEGQHKLKAYIILPNET
ncbi:hypothetical protein Tco_0017427 [Tanacetum coccineum]